MIAVAKPIEWEESKGRCASWEDSRYGFSIIYDLTDSYQASWGEGEAEDFPTLEEAQKWCQYMIDAWVRDNVIVSHESGAFLAPKHTGSTISADGILGRIRDGRYYKELNFGCGTMLSHLEEMASRFYSGDVKAVDEFLQLYDLDESRP